MNQTEQEKDKVGLSFQRKIFPVNIGSSLISYSTILFFMYLGDSLMSYVTPNYLDKNLGSTTLTGILMSFVSSIGIFSSLLIGEYFKRKTYYFFVKYMLLASLLFPLSLILFQPVPLVLILAMALWGIYPEFSHFANAKFISTEVKAEKHSSSWSVLLTFKYLSYTIGPIIAGLIIDRGQHTVFVFAVIFVLISIIGFFVLLKTKVKRAPKTIPLPIPVASELLKVETKKVRKIRIWNEIKVWKTLTKVLWHLVLFLFMVTFIDSAFWTLGPIISESFKKQGVQGELLLFFYMVPSVLIPPLTRRFQNKYSKKKISFITSLIACIFLALSGLTSNAYLFLGLILIYSVISALISPLLNGVFSDYVGRLKETANNLIAFEGFIMDLSYICAPIIAGYISDRTSPQQTFFYIGFIGVIVSILMLFVVPRKIHMPQQQLRQQIQ